MEQQTSKSSTSASHKEPLTVSKYLHKYKRFFWFVYLFLFFFFLFLLMPCQLHLASAVSISLSRCSSWYKILYYNFQTVKAIIRFKDFLGLCLPYRQRKAVMFYMKDLGWFSQNSFFVLKEKKMDWFLFQINILSSRTSLTSEQIKA